MRALIVTGLSGCSPTDINVLPALHRQHRLDAGACHRYGKPRALGSLWDAVVVPDMGESDVFEATYMAKLNALLAPHGLVLTYDRDRAAIDTGLHLFLQGDGGQAGEPGSSVVPGQGQDERHASLETYRAAQTVAVKVEVDHLRFWVAAPEPVYLVVYVESSDEFIAEDVRDIVERQWPRGAFYSAHQESGQSQRRKQ